MRRESKKHATRRREAKPFREQLIAEVGQCEFCNRRSGLVVHEIPRAGVRSHVCDLPACVLVLCDPGCHQTVGNWPKAKQLALQYLRRPMHFDLAIYNRWSIARVSQEDVDEFIAELTGVVNEADEALLWLREERGT